MQNKNNQEIKDELSRAAFGMTAKEAHNKKVCIKCQKEPMFYSAAGRAEYNITALCEFCFDLIMDPDVCQDCNKPISFHGYLAHSLRLNDCQNFVPQLEEPGD